MADANAGADRTPTEITLLRQDNLPLIASVVNAAFTGENMSEISRNELLRVIKSCIERHDASADTPGRFGRSPDYYLAYWAGSHSETSWFGTRQSADGTTFIYLLAPAVRAIEFYNGCGTSGSLASDGDSAMDRLFDEMIQGAARISGDIDARRANIETQIARLEAQRDALEEEPPLTAPERRDIFDRIARAYSDVRTAINALSEKMRETNRKEIDRVNSGSVGKAVREYRARVAEHRASPAYRALQAMRTHLSDATRRSDVADADHVLRRDVSDRGEWDVINLPGHIFDSLETVTTQIHDHELRAVEIQNSLIDSSSLDTHRHLLSLVNEALETYREIRDAHEPSRRDPVMAGSAVTVPRLPRLDATSMVRLSTDIPEMTVRLAPATRVLPQDASAGSALKAAVAQSQHMKARLAQILAPESAGRHLSDLLVDMPVRYGVEEIVRCLDICARKVPSHYSLTDLIAVDVEMDGVRRQMSAPNPLILADGPPSQGHQEVRDVLEDNPDFPLVDGKLFPDVDLRKIDLTHKAST